MGNDKKIRQAEIDKRVNASELGVLTKKQLTELLSETTGTLLKLVEWVKDIDKRVNIMMQILVAVAPDIKSIKEKNSEGVDKP